MYKTIVFFLFLKSFSSLYLLTFLYIFIINVKILNISSFYLKIVSVISILHILPATYQLYRWRVENRDIRVNHASTCIVELLRTCLHAFILHCAPTLSIHIQIQYQCACGCGRSLCVSTHAFYPSYRNYINRNRSNFHVPLEYPRFGIQVTI